MILAALVERGFEVCVPFGGGQPYDLVVDTRSTDHGQGRRPYFGLAHIFGVYFPPEKSVYLVPLDAVGGFRGYLRLEPTRNNQRRKVRFAADYEIDKWSLDSLQEAREKALLAPEPELNFA